MSVENIFGMFDKLDDIVYKPVEVVCNWIEEPLKQWEHERNMKASALNAQQEEDMRRLEIQLKAEQEERAAELEHQKQLWDAEFNEVIAQQEDARRDKLVEAIKNYQIQLANASRDIVESIGMMSLNLRCKANELVLEKTREYKKIQDEAKRQSIEELKEARDNFLECDSDTYRILVDNIMQERRSMVEAAEKCITELSEDLKRLNENTDTLMNKGMDAIDGYLKPIGKKIGIPVNNGNNIVQKIETEIIDANYREEQL